MSSEGCILGSWVTHPADWLQYPSVRQTINPPLAASANHIMQIAEILEIKETTNPGSKYELVFLSHMLCYTRFLFFDTSHSWFLPDSSFDYI